MNQGTRNLYAPCIGHEIVSVDSASNPLQAVVASDERFTLLYAIIVLVADSGAPDLTYNADFKCDPLPSTVETMPMGHMDTIELCNFDDVINFRIKSIDGYKHSLRVSYHGYQVQ